MPIIDPYKQSFTSKGWICSTCGAWVPDGTLHQCGGKGYAAPTDPYDAITLLTARVQTLELRVKNLEEELSKLREEICKGK